MITDEKILELITKLDDFATDFVDFDFGLPIYSKRENLIAIVRNWLEKNGLIWIPVEKKLPDVDIPVLALFENQICMLVRRDISNSEEDIVIWANTYGDFNADTAEYDDDYKPTHWMPLPEIIPITK